MTKKIKINYKKDLESVIVEITAAVFANLQVLAYEEQNKSLTEENRWMRYTYLAQFYHLLQNKRIYLSNSETPGFDEIMKQLEIIDNYVKLTTKTMAKYNPEIFEDSKKIFNVTNDIIKAYANS